MALKDKDVLKKIAEAIKKASDAGYHRAPALRPLKTELDPKECDFLAAIALRAIRDAGCAICEIIKA